MKMNDDNFETARRKHNRDNILAMIGYDPEIETHSSSDLLCLIEDLNDIKDLMDGMLSEVNDLLESESYKNSSPWETTSGKALIENLIKGVENGKDE